ncbi:MAG: ATP-binding protein [Acidobacteriota bacterium]|nr:ATP-binding protein [Acidobacteriota bacterium]
MKKFDLNIEKVLENWDISHALREIIANSLDEQALTKSKDIEIFQDGSNNFHIRDYGRGLRYEHLTQNENDEKLKNSHLVIGKFGVGLKDALATFDRQDVAIFVKSNYGEITVEKSAKHGFEDVVTLHAFISEPSDKDFVGTEFIFSGVSSEEIEKAKSYFLKFSDETLVEKTQYGEVLFKQDNVGKIYINGLLVAEEENFLFSYNITSLTQVMRKALNRERTNVGRIAYTDRIKTILLSCQRKIVAKFLVNDLQEFESGSQHDEVKWTDVAVYACQLLNANDKVIFLTPQDVSKNNNSVDDAKLDGFKIVFIPENIKAKIKGLKDVNGQPIRDLSQYITEYNESFSYSFVSMDNLLDSEKAIFNLSEKVFSLINAKPKTVREILISETMRKEVGLSETVGVYEPSYQRIIIKRSQLRNKENYVGTLLHETAHAISGACDVNRDFEIELTRLLGIVGTHNLV